MIKTSRQLKDLIRNLSKEKKADAQILMRNYMMERFLERVSLSPYKNEFILKGGMLVAAIVGLDARSTMDMDVTIMGAPVDVDAIAHMMAEILSVPVNDGVEFHIRQVSEIMDESEYPGVRVSIEALFDGVRTPLKIDISTGNAITPREVRYSFRLMLEERTIELWAYNLETVLAEKLETIIVRTITNTRMRDFYDVYILMQLHSDSLNPSIFVPRCWLQRRSGVRKSCWRKPKLYLTMWKIVRLCRGSGLSTERSSATPPICHGLSSCSLSESYMRLGGTCDR